MPSTILCPQCKKDMAEFNSYFGTYCCKYCGWKDTWFRDHRDKWTSEKNIYVELDKHLQKETKRLNIQFKRKQKLTKITGRINE
jgi:hydrogenase maturation factor HypF (carbamoyltransferase family)